MVALKMKPGCIFEGCIFEGCIFEGCIFELTVSFERV